MNALFPLTLSTGLFVLFSIFLGFLFGFFLERAGFGSALKLTGQFYLNDWSVLKVMFGAIVVACLGLVLFSMMGIVDFGMIYVPDAYYLPMLIGGLMVGLGFIVGGYCPGTGVVAASTGKWDGLVFLAGIVAGIFVFGVTEPSFHDFFTGGSSGPVTLSQLTGLPSGVFAFLLAAMAIGAFWMGEKVERAMRMKRTGQE
jgi:hypothetical protein